MLLDDDVDAVGFLVEVEEILLDAVEEIIVEALHEVDLDGVLGGVGDGHVERDVPLGSQPATLTGWYNTSGINSTVMVESAAWLVR